jgi:hypothetical protein
MLVFWQRRGGKDRQRHSYPVLKQGSVPRREEAVYIITNGHTSLICGYWQKLLCNQSSPAAAREEDGAAAAEGQGVYAADDMDCCTAARAFMYVPHQMMAVSLMKPLMCLSGRASAHCRVIFASAIDCNLWADVLHIQVLIEGYGAA